jgi:AraC-like DNA-binding protein
MADPVANRTFVTDEALRSAEPGHLLSIPGRPRLHLVHAAIDHRPSQARHRETHTHPVWHLVAVTRGKGSFLSGSETVKVKAPFVFLVSPEHPHAFEREAGDTTIYSELTFEYRTQPSPLDDWSRLLSLWTSTPCSVPPYASISATAAEEMRDVARSVVTATHAGHPELAKLLQGYLNHALFLVWRHMVADRAHPLKPDQLILAQRFIATHCHEEMTLEDVASHVGLSPKHLGRAFKQRFGATPMMYRRRLSLERAAVLLRTSAHPIKSIASLVGFDDVQYFNRAFRKLHGVPPASFRKGEK